MNLGEALTLRADIQRRIEQLRRRLSDVVVVDEGGEPLEDPQALLGEFRRLADELERLVVQINQTNLRTMVGEAGTLTDALARRDSLDLRVSVLRSVADAAAQREWRLLRSEVRLVPTVDVPALRMEIDELAQQRRTLNVLLQQANWTSELLD